MSVDGLATCSKCHADILWVATKNGKMQPLDAIPDPAGNVRLEEPAVYRSTQRGALRASQVITKAERESLFPIEGDRYMPHHATCPFAEEFRKPKAKAS